jgi:hypothetical protein
MTVVAACDALEAGRCLELRYRDELLCVEVHAVGYDAAGAPLLHCWQRVGYAGEGWRTLPLGEARVIDIAGYFSEAPRPGYRLDTAMATILCEA